MPARRNKEDERLLLTFLQQIRSRQKKRGYRQAIVHFEDFARLRTRSIALRTLRLWLQDGRKQWVLPGVIRNAQRVNRFAEWLVAQKFIKSNPLAQFRARYEIGSTADLVRALQNPKPRAALEALRPLPLYGSHLGPLMREHVKRMRALGFRYRHECRLQHFDRFLQRRAGSAKQPLSVLVQEYSALAPTAATKLLRIAVGRVVAAALNRCGVATPIPRIDWLLRRQALREKRRPYIYTEDEIRKLLRTALELPSPLAPYRPQTVYTMLVLAYCAGLRLGEICALTLGALDLQGGAVEIRNTKFFKSRRLPLSASALEAVRNYLAVRRNVGAPDRPDAPLFWHDSGPYHYVTVGALMALVIRRAGLKQQRGRTGPRTHDIRHAFVVHRMTKWYRLGINPESRLPYLATYLGHRSVRSTLVYLTVTEELLQHASERFRAAEPEVRKAILGTPDA